MTLKLVVQIPQAGVSSLGGETWALILLFLSFVGSLAESSSLCSWPAADSDMSTLSYQGILIDLFLLVPLYMKG